MEASYSTTPLNKNFDFLICRGCFQGLGEVSGVFLRDFLGGIWDMFGRF